MINALVQSAISKNVDQVKQKYYQDKVDPGPSSKILINLNSIDVKQAFYFLSV
jgi:hypothetical protein